MTTIWKYSVPFPSGLIVLPKYGQILALQMQGRSPMLWARVNPDAKIESRSFRFYGTGHALPDDPGQYIGTVQDQEFVWHLFEETDRGKGGSS